MRKSKTPESDQYVRRDRLVDVHAHFLPPFYVDEAIDAGYAVPDGMSAWPEWSLDDHLRVMDAAGIDQSVLSLSSPGLHVARDKAATALARRTNNFAADLQMQQPDRLHFFASLPLPDVDGSLLEMTRALDELCAVGVTMESNNQGQYLSHPDLDDLWCALDERDATVFIHPTSPPGFEQATFGLPRLMLEFPFETTRAIVGLVLSGVLERYPRVRIIVPHVGQLLPAIIERVEMFHRSPNDVGAGADFRTQLGRLWFDLAGTPMPSNAGALMGVVGPDRMVYGSDYCFATPAVVNDQMRSLDEGWHRIDDMPWRVRTSRNVDALFACPRPLAG